MTYNTIKLLSNITKITGDVESSSMTLAELGILLNSEVFDLKLKSTALGNGSNPDNPPFDSTSHITLQSYQKALQATNYNGESIRLDFMNDFAKSTIAFRDGRGANATSPKTKAWLVAHYEANGYDTRPIHKHFSIEVSNVAGSLETRMEFPYDQDICNIRFHESTVTNIQNSFQVASNDTSNSGFVLQRWSNDTLSGQADERYNGDKAIYTRWKMQFTDNPVGGDPALKGDNFVISRWNDTGSFIDNVLKIVRSNSRVGIGTNLTEADITHKLTVIGDQTIRGANPVLVLDRNAQSGLNQLSFGTNKIVQWTHRQPANTDNIEVRNNTNAWTLWKGIFTTKHLMQSVPSSLIDDSNLDNSSLAMSFNQATNELKFKGKYSNGTIKTFTLPEVLVDSVNGQTGVVVITKSDVGLSNVDNTSDLSKPISTATQTELNNIITATQTELDNITNIIDGQFTPAYYGFLSWSFDPALITASSQPTAGVMQVMRARSVGTKNIKNVLVNCATGGNTVNNAYCSIYDISGNLLGQSDEIGSTFAGIGVKTYNFSTAITVTGDYLVAFWFGSATTMPAISRTGVAGVVNATLSATNLRYSTSETGITTTPPATLGTRTATALAWWFATN